MRTVATRLSLAALFLSCVCAAQTSLTDEQVVGAINHALSGKRYSIGLTLNDVQTNVFSGLTCRTCKTTGYTIYVYTPESWIELKAFQARREMLPFSLADVTFEMRLPYIHVLASPSRPEYLNASGMGMASSVHRVVLSNTDRSDVVQPLSESHDQVELNSALRSFTQASAGAVFSMEDVERLRSEDPNHEFFIVVVGDNKNKYFKVKSRFFKQLFGEAPEPKYSARKSPSAPGKTIEAVANGNPDEPMAVPSAPTPSPVSNTLDSKKVATATSQPRTSEPAQIRQARTNGAPAIESPRALVASNSKSGAPTATRPKAVIRPKSILQTPVAAAAAGSSNDAVSAPESDVLKHDNALIAEWWHLSETNVDSSGMSRPPVYDSKTTGPNLMVRASIGAWSDEKPTIRHDGVRVDHLLTGGPADQVGVEVGDEILALGSVYVFTAQELMGEVYSYKPGNRVAIRFRRRSTIYDNFVVIGSEGDVSSTSPSNATELPTPAAQ